jgi:hypothetical protein
MTRIEATGHAGVQTLRLLGLLAGIGVGALAVISARSADGGDAQTWVASWASAMHGPYPFGNASAQPVLDFAFENAEVVKNRVMVPPVIR